MWDEGFSVGEDAPCRQGDRWVEAGVVRGITAAAVVSCAKAELTRCERWCWVRLQYQLLLAQFLGGGSGRRKYSS